MRRRAVAFATGAFLGAVGLPADAAVRYYTVAPCRAVDTRDAALGGPSPLAAGTPRAFPLAGRCGTPPTASGLILNITVTQPSANGFVTVYPGGAAIPPTSTVNYKAGATRANTAVVRLGSGVLSAVAGQALGSSVHLIIDVSGYFDDPANNQPPFVSAGSPQRIQLPGFGQTGSVTLNGVVTDDAKPVASPSVSWSLLSGPGAVTFSTPGSAATSATFSQAGTYVLRLSANDTALGGHGDTTVVVAPSRDAWRLVQQATWGATLALATQAQNLGAGAWIDAQIAAPPTGYPQYALQPGSIPSTCTGDCRRDNYSLYLPQRHFFVNALYGQDQLRQRVLFALHKIIPLTTQQPGQLVPYLHILRNNALGDFRELLREITLNVAMGAYLDMITSTARRPNENYAREVLQLFSIGTDLLNPDGTPQRDGNGNIIPTYDQSVVDGFTKVLTGWTYPLQKTPGIINYLDPMRVVETNHDQGDKLLLGNVTRAGGYTATEDLAFALDNIFFHANVGPFISRQLVQQLVTSNPTPAYVGRVSAVFDNDGSGRRGNLAAVVKAILLDPEARGNAPADPRYGHLKEPVLFALNLLRAFDARSADALGQSDGYINPQTQAMDQDVWRPPSVFSYFPADFEVPGEPGVAGPEFGILSASTALRRANFVNTVVFNGIPKSQSNTNAPLGTSLNIDALYGVAWDPASLVDEVSMRLFGGDAAAPMRTSLIGAVAAVPAANPKLRIQQAIYLAASSSQFQVQR